MSGKVAVARATSLFTKEKRYLYDFDHHIIAEFEPLSIFFKQVQTAVASTVKKNFGVAIDVTSTADFYHVTENLYIVRTPKNGSKNTCIEDISQRCCPRHGDPQE